LQNLFDDVKNFVLYLVEYPLVEFSCGQDAGILQVDQVPGGLVWVNSRMWFQVGYAHFSIHHDQVRMRSREGSEQARKI